MTSPAPGDDPQVITRDFSLQHLTPAVQQFPAYRLSGAPTRGGRVRFRGFAAVPCEVS